MLQETGTHAESPLPPAILRGLGDRSYDKRKTAALDVTSLIKSLQEAGWCVSLCRIGLLHPVPNDILLFCFASMT